MDPAAILPQHIMEEILKSFGGKELIQLMLISRSWHEVISSSTICMAKICLEIRGDWMDEYSVESIATWSYRKYGNILISVGTENYDHILRIMSQDFRRWKSVKIYDIDLENSEEFEKFVRTFEPTVQHLDINGMKIIEPDSELMSFNFGSLKSLQISYCDVNICSSFLMASWTNLTSLNISSLGHPEKEEVSLLKYLTKLKILRISGNWFHETFSPEPVEWKFQLEEFSISFMVPCNPEIHQNFLAFLRTQTCLNRLELNEWFSYQITEFFFNMKTLKHCTVMNFVWGAEFLPQSESIETFDMQTVNIYEDSPNIAALLKALPNVKRIKMRSINEFLAVVIKDRCKKLEEILLVHPCTKKTILNDILPHVKIE